MAERSDHSDRDKRDRIERLRKRLDDLGKQGHFHPYASVIKGILDLLADEL